MDTALPNLLNAIAIVLDIILTVYMYVIIARVIMSWINPDPYNPIVQSVYRLTDPVLRPIRRKLPDMGPVDLSPMVVILVIVFLKYFLVATLKAYAMKAASKPWYEKYK